MGYLIIIFLIVILITIITCGYGKESFYIRKIYNPSYLERNPLLCYISESEYYLDNKYFNEILSKKFPLKVTTKKSDMLSSDLALLPEPIILEEKDSNNNYPYDYLSHIKDISYYLLELSNNQNPIKSISDLKNKRIYIHDGGYVKKLWLKLLKFYKYKEGDIELTFYKTVEEGSNALKNGKCDALALLTENPNEYVFKLSYEMKIHIIPLSIDESIIDLAKYFLKGLKKTKISAKFYRYPYLRKNYDSYGFSLSMFIRKNIKEGISEKLTQFVFQPSEGITRSAALGGSDYIPFNNGTRNWLIKNGYISISENEDIGCSLVAGKSVCEGKIGKYAKDYYKKNFWGSTIPNDDTAISYLIKTNQNAEPEFEGSTNKCEYDDETNQNYQCMYKKVCPDNYTSRSIFRRVIDDSYVCFEDMTLRTQANCERDGKTWDRPCLKDSDCPFYQANQNYPNNFGQCNKGFCELPLGVMPVAYRKYESNPICHNCPSDNPRCCDKTSIMASPDYAFANDRFDRLKNSEELELRGINI